LNNDLFPFLFAACFASFSVLIVYANNNNILQPQADNHMTMTQEFFTISPIDGSIVVQRPYATTEEIQAALARAEFAQRSWRHTPLAIRASLVTSAVEILVSQKADIAEELTRQMGRPIRDTPNELNGFEARARHMIKISAAALADVVPAPIKGYTRFIQRAPVGVVLVVAPWNYPLLTAVNAIVPALLAGNCVILKHSVQTPLVAERFAAAFRTAGLPVGVFQYLHTSHEDTSRMVSAPEINFVCFTGSVAGGIEVEKAAMGRFIGVGLELGGNDPAYVRDDADLPHAVETLVDGAFFNAGQSCCGIQRIYVHQSLHKEFLERAVALAKAYVLGDPFEPSTTLGPVVSVAAAANIRAIVVSGAANFK
jgi:acyl-CoA reductase-like NAD-dependent aldehyde dehydrogenase